MASNQAQAVKAKEDGNNFYKQQKFAEAVKCYKTASSLDPENPVYLSNESAVLFQSGLYFRCIQVAREALRMLSGKPDPSSLVPKLRARLIKCYAAIGEGAAAAEELKDATLLAEETPSYVESVNAHIAHMERVRADPLPLPINCAFPSIRGSLQSPYHQYDRPISHEHPSSLLNLNPESAEYPSILAATDATHCANVDLLFAQNEDLRHVFTAIKTWMVPTKEVNKASVTALSNGALGNLTVHLQEQNPRVLARHVLFLYVLGHPDMEDAMRAQAANWAYYAWLSIGLIPPHFTMLVDTLHELCRYSFNLDTWRMNPATSWIKFFYEKDLKAVRDCWIMWGAATEDESRCRRQLTDRIRQLKDLSGEVLQYHYSTTFSTDESRESSRGKIEQDFFKNNHVLLPPPSLLEGDTSSEPKSFHKWLINPTLDVADPAVSFKDGTANVWVPEGRPDGIIFGNDPYHVQAFLRANPQLQQAASSTGGKGKKKGASNVSYAKMPPFASSTALWLGDVSLVMAFMRKENLLSVRCWHGTFPDFNNFGAPLCQAVMEDKIAFDRIHTGNLSQCLGTLQTLVNAELLLKPNLAHTGIVLFSDVHLKDLYKTTHAYMYSRLRVEEAKALAPLGIDYKRIFPRNDEAMALLIPGVFPERDYAHDNEAAIDQALRDASGWDLNVIKVWAHDIFAYLCMPPTVLAKPGFEPAIDPAASNLNTFVRLLELLLRRGVPASVVQLIVHQIYSGEIFASVLDDCLGKTNAPERFTTTPYLMELSTLLTIARGHRLARVILTTPTEQRHPLLQDVNAVHYYEATNVTIDNHRPVISFPFNPSLVILIVDKTVKFQGNTTLVERLSMCKNRADYNTLLKKYASNIQVVSTVYWVGPATTKNASQVSFGFWLPPSFISKVPNRAQQTLLMFRVDLYMCVGLSSLATMTCNTA